MSPTPTKLHRQSGAALALSLMMMAVLTLLSVASMNSTLLEMLMAGNLQFQTRTLINAENALVTAEAAAQTMPLQTSYSASSGQYNMVEDGVQDPLTMTWDGTTSVSASDVQNRYMLEHAGIQTVAGNSGAWGQGGTGTSVSVIRVTAHSEGTKGAVRMVQSVFVK